MKVCNNCTKVHSDNSEICDVCGGMSFTTHNAAVNQIKKTEEVKKEKKGIFQKKDKKSEKRKK